MQSPLMRVAGSGLAVFLFCGTAAANTLSDTYFSAFTNPPGFEFSFLSRIVNEVDFYKNFDSCATLAMAALNELEKQTRASYTACRENSECHQRAKDVQTVVNLRIKVRDLGKYIDATRSKNAPDFVTSDVGQIAILQYNVSNQLQIPVSRNPEFIREIGILQSVPCR